MNKPTCYACIRLYDGADGVKRCRVSKNGQPVSPMREKLCDLFVREVGSDDEGAPPWYVDAWHVGGEGRGD